MITVFYEKNKMLWWIGMGLYLAIVIFLTFSLISYSPTDSSWLYVSSDVASVSNYGGFFGAQVAAILFYFFGGASFLFLIPLLCLGLIFAFNGSMRKEWERLCAALYLVFVGAALLTFYGIDLLWSPYPGGLMGLALSKNLVYYFDPLGCALFLYGSLCASFVLLSRWSFMFAVQYGIAVVYAIGMLLKKYRVVSKALYIIKVCSYAVCVTIPLFFIDFIRSLFNGAAFNNTGLIHPEDDDLTPSSVSFDGDSYWKKMEIRPNVTRSVAVMPVQYCVLSLMRHDNAPGVLKSPIVPVIVVLADSVGLDNTSVDEYESYNDSDEDIQIERHKPAMTKKSSRYALPDMDIFVAERSSYQDYNVEKELQERAQILQDKLKRFGVHGKVIAIKRGPVVTLFEYQPEIDTKLSKIIVLEDDLAMALQAMSIRIIAPIPGRSVVGFEVANTTRHDVLFSHITNQTAYTEFSGSLPLVLGKGTIGEVVVVDLVKMPHLLIAGSTGSGKSVALNAILISLLCKLGPDELKLILIDPKRLEFAAFTDIAHLLFPIVTSPAHAAPVLRWVVQEMEERYEKMARCGARNIADYNTRVLSSTKLTKNDQDEVIEEQPLPFIVVVIDELADLMITAGRDIEDLITRITQMARAAGIHMIVATQRPSVDVITGLIKANFPSRISFRVASRIDSRTILDTMGADRLLGRGDMLFLDAATSQLRRVHGAYVSDEEIEQVADHIRHQRKVEYLDMQHVTSLQGQDVGAADDVLYKDVRSFLNEIDEISISLLQRKFRIGYNRSARIIDILESQGLIMPQDGGKTRKVIR